MGEGRRGEVEACWPDGPGRLEVVAAGEEQMEGQEEEVERKQEKEVGAWFHEKGREERRTKKQKGGGWRFGAPLSCEARVRRSSQLAWGGSTSASGRLMSLIGTLERSYQDVHINQKILKKYVSPDRRRITVFTNLWSCLLHLFVL